jgi:hypothetical protein
MVTIEDKHSWIVSLPGAAHGVSMRFKAFLNTLEGLDEGD